MRDFGLTGIWEIPGTEDKIRDEFRKEFNEVTETIEDGLHTYFFCRYHDATIVVELLYVIVVNGHAYFLWTPAMATILLDKNLKFVDIDMTSDGNIFPLLFLESDVEYIGDVCHPTGNVFRLYSFTSDSEINNATDKHDNDLVPLHYLRLVDDTDYAEMGLQYLLQITEAYQTRIEQAITSDAPYDGIDENPFQNRFYDKDINRDI
jgi:hypothetical protein